MNHLQQFTLNLLLVLTLTFGVLAGDAQRAKKDLLRCLDRAGEPCQPLKV